MKISEIHIRGFKSIVDQKLSLGRVNCLIGANGVGKSNLLEAIGVLSAAASGRVDDEAIIRRGVRAGLPRLFKTSFANLPIPSHITLEAQSHPAATFRVSLLNPLDNPNPAWSFKTEALLSEDKEVVTRGVRSATENLDPKAGLAALKVVELLALDPASLLLKALQSYAIYTPNTPALRGVIPDPQTRAPIGLSGGGLAEAFDALSACLHEDTLDEILDLIDWLNDVQSTRSASALLSPAVARTTQVLKFTDRFMAPSRNTLTAYDASEGALYVLFAAILCLSPASPPLFAIDNIDSALNPRLVTRLVERLSSWLLTNQPNKQLIFTAHNPAVLDGLKLDDDEIRLFAIERNSEGHTTIRRVELSLALRTLNTQYPLSRLWAMGHLGAVPNV